MGADTTGAHGVWESDTSHLEYDPSPVPLDNLLGAMKPMAFEVRYFASGAGLAWFESKSAGNRR